MAYYTGSGDSGETGALGSRRLKKSDKLIVAIGDVDELNSAIGVAVTNLTDNHVADMLKSVQNSLFVIGAELAASTGGKGALKAKITNEKVKELEKGIEELGSTLPELKKFVLPGGSVGGSHLHLARSVCRRAERSVVSASEDEKVSDELKRYMNRLSSFLFVAALYINKKEDVEEMHPVY